MAGKGWRGEIELLRGFAMLGIVFIHVGAFADLAGRASATAWACDYLIHLADFGVPLFFAISGYMLAWKHPRPSGAPGFLWKRLKFILPPYLAFSAVYGAYNVIVLGEPVPRAAASFALFDAAGAFWFVAVIIQLYVLYPLLARRQSDLEARGQGARLLLASALLYVAWHALLGPWASSGIDSLGGGLGRTITERLFPGYLLFFVIGMHAARHGALASRLTRALGSLPMAAVALLGAAALMYLGDGLWWRLLVVPYFLVASAGLVRASFALMRWGGLGLKGLEAIGKYSFGIYLAHVLVIALVVNRLNALSVSPSGPLFYVVLYPATVAISLALLVVLSRLPYGHLIAGARRNRGPSA